MRIQYFFNEVKIKSSLFINKRLVYFEHLGLEGAFGKENDSYKGNIRKTVLKRSQHLKCPTFTQYLKKKKENEPLIFYYQKQLSFLWFIIVNFSCTKSAYNNVKILVVDFSTGALRSLRHMQRHALGQLRCSRGREKILYRPEIKTLYSCQKGHSMLVFVKYSALNIKVHWKSSLPKRKVPKPKGSYTRIPFLFCCVSTIGFSCYCNKLPWI